MENAIELRHITKTFGKKVTAKRTFPWKLEKEKFYPFWGKMEAERQPS